MTMYTLALPGLLRAQGLQLPPADSSACIHLQREPVETTLPCPILYNCHDGHRHVCQIELNASGQRCTGCGDVDDEEYLETCRLGATTHPTVPCPGH
ncbi:uncharacterized protein PGTG_19454 [Puccinia graminis f. sp. tritici CRL 75-36-700-3]|uniref:Uncharacterized protein n=1 Tax=Puccinia graminis f. sp. tritici (strain CRL 75-36-700-3 / race SCCL) TaxID=418459 RepID=E3L9J0_PUCGT|nr:uncharacterized protein PGTG_19454 [Puccinia graminis f. sp. tritici CRL 75-36-700-3]EFP93215.2 hypothetical protein PGTG_19454 [Puccinia graminis f. sp. tritici CRL 75-36-700-3]